MIKKKRNSRVGILTRLACVLVMVSLLTVSAPANFFTFTTNAGISARKPRRVAIAPQSAPPEPFIVGAQPSNPILTILAVEAFASIKTSVLAMFADVSVARTSVRAFSTTEDTENTENTESTENSANPDSETEVQPAPPQPASIVDFDFDNDGKTDIGRWKPTASEFEIDPSGGGSNLVYDIGSSTSKFVPGDFNGDGNVDAAVFDSGTWTYKTSTTATAINITLGQSGDIPVPANYDTHVATDAAVFRPSNGTWYIKQSSTGNTVSVAFGTTGDIPVTGDFDGDGKADQAVFRPSTGVWHINGSQAGYYGSGFGVASDVPVPADYDGDGKTDVAVYRGSTGTWYVQTSGTDPDITQVWGNYGDQPVAGDYDGDNKADLAVWRPSTGVWYIAKSSGGHEYHTLGVPGDRAVPSAFIKQIGGDVAPYELAKARLSPKNATGGTDLYSQNFSWGTSLVGLPGRAGLNAGFGMSYNSLVWTKEGSNVHFDTNYDNISPGFRFGFPIIEAPYYVPGSGETANPYFAYVMVSPSGARTEFRQIAASNTFETADSSYLQLKTKVTPDPNQPAEEISLTVRGTDGTQMSYVWIAGAFRCWRILDRNGNYITIDYSEYGQLTKVTDTLGREINVNYSEDLYPTSITQTWKADNGLGSNVTHTWATFGYANVTLNPTWNVSITSTGPPAGTILKVLEKVTYPDLSSTKFYYNTYGQVSKIENIAADSPTHVLNRVRTNLESPGSNLTDVPRLGETRTFVENFNSGNETVVTNTLATGHQPADIDGNPVTAAMIQVTMLNHPTGNITNTYVGESGWMEGLPILVNDYANGNYYTPQRSSWTRWTQDDVNSADIQNPRVTETKIGDGVNLKRSTIDYLLYPSTTISKFGLVNAVNVYDTNQSTVLKRAETDYNLAAAYVDRRIIGVPTETRVFGYESSQLELVSKMTYGFDEGTFTQEPNQIISPIRHDTTNYGSSFIIGRGNMTSTTRHDVTSQTAAVTSLVLYDIAGSPVAQFDPVNRQVRIEYTDVFNDTGTSRNTFAYPTKVYDPAGNYSQVKYRHDIGANVWAKSPAPDGNSQGKITERYYDSIGRLLKDKIVNHGGAYKRYEYPNNGIQSKVFSTITDINSNNVGDSADEVLSESWSDGAGRVRKSRMEHPGSTGGWSGSTVEYDILGRAKKQSVPTEISVPNPNDPETWSPAGDDATRGWLYTYQKYDWMGRVIRKINTDGIDQTTLNDSDVLISYAGCGCAGGLETTIQSESVPRDDQPGTFGRRTQKVYDDILGRSWKTVVMKWDGTTPYTTTEQQFNGRDQVLESIRIDNTSTTSPQASQVVTMSYDGHGRLATQHLPKQDANANTSFAYNADDSVSVKTDGRGATATMTYNERGLVTQIDNVSPVATPTPTPSPTPTPPPTTTSYYAPIGFLDSVNDSNAIAFGWSLDPDNPYASNVVHFYIGGPAGSGTYVGQAVADKPRPDVNTNTGHPGNHGFEFSIPAQYLNGQTNSIYAYGLDTGANSPTHLSNSPKAFNVLPPIVPPPTNTTINFGYDSIGNRISMTDPAGSMTYEYDELSRMTSETRQFADTLTHAPLPNNSFKLTYTYHLAGALKSLTDPYNDVINYSNDKAGRLDAVTGSTFGGVTNYASNPGYRAWGGLKELSYGNGVEMNMTFDNRLLPDHYELKKNTTDILKKNYEYNQDGSLKYLQDQLNNRFDRLNIYDHAGRIKEAKTGLEARGGTVTDQQQQTQDLPYRQSFEFNAFGNMTQRNNLHWGIDNWHGQSNNLNYTYQNDRITNPAWQYDADGRSTQSFEGVEYTYSTYDARGLLTIHNTSHSVWNTFNQSIVRRFYSGDGREVKRMKRTFTEDTNQTTPPYGSWAEVDTIYYIRSTVLGGEVVSETYPLGQKRKTFVMAAGAKVATQSAYLWNSSSNKSVYWEHYDASGMSYVSTASSGVVTYGGGQYEGAPAELDPMGGNVGLETPYIEEPIQPPPPEPDFPYTPMSMDQPLYVNGQRVSCTLDGFSIGCSSALSMLGHSADIDFRYTSTWALSQVGIFAVYNPNSGRTPPPDSPTSPDGTIRVTTNQDAGRWEYYFNASWNITTRVQDVIVPIGDVESKAQKLILGNQACANFINKLLDKVAENTGNPHVNNPFSGNVVDFSPQMGRVGGVLKSVDGRAYGRVYSLPDQEGRRDSFGIIGISPLSSGWVNAESKYIFSYIHEAIHNAARYSPYMDKDLAIAAFSLISADGKSIAGVPQSATDDYEKIKEKGTNGDFSDYWDTVVLHFCPDANGWRERRFSQDPPTRRD